MGLSLVGLVVLAGVALYGWLDTRGQARVHTAGKILAKHMDPHAITWEGDMPLPCTAYSLRVELPEGLHEWEVDAQTYAKAQEGMPVDLTGTRGRWSGRLRVEELHLV